MVSSFLMYIKLLKNQIGYEKDIVGPIAQIENIFNNTTKIMIQLIQVQLRNVDYVASPALTTHQQTKIFVEI